MNRSTKRVIITSIVGGLLSGAVKIGWEAIVPPRGEKKKGRPLSTQDEKNPAVLSHSHSL